MSDMHDMRWSPTDCFWALAASKPGVDIIQTGLTSYDARCDSVQTNQEPAGQMILSSYARQEAVTETFIQTCT